MISYKIKDLPEDTKVKHVDGVWIKASEYKEPIDLLKEKIIKLEKKMETK